MTRIGKAWVAAAARRGGGCDRRGQAPAHDLTIALTGDSIITRKLSVYAEPAFTRLIDLVRGADAAFTNIEMLFHDFEPYPMNESGGTYMRAEPALAKELAWAGFDLGSLANNHTGDYGALGMRLTKKYVAEAGIVAAGSGESLTEAREARFLDTPKGRDRARLGGVHVPGSLARRPHPRRRPGPARAEPAALHHHLRRDQGAASSSCGRPPASSPARPRPPATP